MTKLSEMLRALLDNPDDLSTLPQMIALAEQSESEVDGYLDRIAKLQDVNKSYLAQIPIPSADPQPVEEQKDPTMREAVDYIIESLGGNK